ncbi:MAG TPA: BON domain-containing protein [Haliscomenobacter sp.]|uniref:BON domain-containing protein n=1 Tax=Haliscomenobacter sp. TaxID=2717303 RepID=UPI002C154896|nr:BON domain-containing protein [Haliscomenobacter sp.]HOY20971.1 BON domain-containing protein [Haliscomenobacter sp.]
MKSNEVLQKDVQDAIKWEPLLNVAEIGVTAKDGVVTLSGTVDSYAKKMEAEAAAKSVMGVKAVVEKIEIKLGDWAKITDGEIAIEVLNAFNWNWDVPKDKIKVKVEAGWLTLDGEVNWYYQKEAAKKSVKTLNGVKGVNDNITIRSENPVEIQKRDIELALARNGSLNANDIEVIVSGSNVKLVGRVNSWLQREEAGRIAWNAPGVWSLDNELMVSFNEEYVY